MKPFLRSQHKLLFEDASQVNAEVVVFFLGPSGWREGFQIEFPGAVQDFKRRFENDVGPNTGEWAQRVPPFVN